MYRWAWKPGFEWADPAWEIHRATGLELVIFNHSLRTLPRPRRRKAANRQANDGFPTTGCAAPSRTPESGRNESRRDQRITFQYFHDQLAPFGTWVEVPGIGPCWYPEKVIAANPDWRPYYDSGRWVQTENGLFWASDYTWGDIPFHYGRWIQDPRYGWLWVPDYNWGPAWVCWRACGRGCIGWAPLPYGAVWVDGGWRFHGRAVVDVGFDFGLGEDFFVFVGYDHFHEGFPPRLRGHEREYRLPHRAGAGA